MAEFKSKLNKGHAFTSKCASLVKEQRARLYILRRCATMLCCWYIQGDDSMDIEALSFGCLAI
ncbi:hypothetical protein ARALYDRAFT_892420 [Arabidopsis lyrata subsp. lyrata]|uniref:Uncharacterized protein n=1 Tax=Arabidopsis lyrata subsp. lyrata TaxID=81972 RepID=D7KLA5_ARALL|nr:hypothetical protein ARALYDRAFT_892420 [Arabidopsis lyrata subsp. lyrata]